ncbi:LCP family protein [Terrabacter carboxydivorans]|uniref:Cell envelope-related transcriptional attenuator domain-containing protein n=1 Tax=Terrabacter carboxydivorans TaxID=619730 RepID=A0ABN3LFP1_9MICO
MSYPNTRGQAAPPTREALRRELKSGFRRALGLTALGTVVPGAGLTQTRSRKAGWAILVIALAGIGVGAYYVLRTGLTNAVLSLVARPTVLQAIAITFVVIGILWCGSIILTAVQSRPTRLDKGRTRLLAAFTTLMVFLVAASSFKFAEYASITQTTVAQVFGTAPVKPGVGAQVAQGSDPWADQARVNILLLGSDAGVGRTGTRTDSMIVASIDTKTGRTALISLPRNLQRVPLPKASPLRGLYPSGTYGRPVCFREQKDPNDQCMLNAVWTEVDQYRQDHPGSYTGSVPGRDETRNVISEVLGLKIDHTVVIDLKGFSQLIDAMGGVTVNVKLSGFGTKLPIGGHSDGRGGVVGETGYFSPGVQHLSGNLALWYARTRAADSDTYRQARQRCVIQAVVRQVDPAQMVSKYPEIARIARDNIYTDIPAQNLPAFVDLIERVQKDNKITSVSFDKIPDFNSVRPNYDEIRAYVQKSLQPPAPSTPSTPKPTSTSTRTPTKAPSPTTKPYDEC